MVNVNSQIPFNLHNQSLDLPTDPSSSRSASLSTRYGFPPNHPRAANLPNLSLTPIHSPINLPSSSRSSSAESAPYDHNNGRRSSLAASESGNSDIVPIRSAPILNVRLVNHRGYGSIGTRQGRPRVRAGSGASQTARQKRPDTLDPENSDGDAHIDQSTPTATAGVPGSMSPTTPTATKSKATVCRHCYVTDRATNRMRVV